MGYMALLRNLRNFDDAGVDDKTAKMIAARLADPEEVKNSKQFPYQYHTAWLNVPSARWKNSLDKALNLSVPNIPVLDGSTLILVDTSGSMTAPMSTDPPGRKRSRKAFDPAKGTVTSRAPKVPSRMGAAALFGIALGKRNPGKVDLHAFATGQQDLTSLTTAPEGILEAMDILERMSGNVGHGTQIREAVDNCYKGHDRVFIFTDMQTMRHSDWPGQDVAAKVPSDRHVYGFNLAGYSATAVAPGEFRHELGGLTDDTFSLVKNIEQGMSGQWPWL
jgi:hypothetical protein